MSTIQRVYGYSTAALYDSRGMAHLVAPANTSLPTDHFTGCVQPASSSREVVFADLHRAQATLPIHMSFLVPIGIKPQVGRPADGVLLLLVDPERFLYPLVQTWPTPSGTAETLLIRQEGNDVVFLNELRHRSSTALALRLSTDPKLQLPAAMAVEGKGGVVEGMDYRGIPVVAVLRKVHGTPWYMVAKVDRREIYAPLRRRAGNTGVIAGLLLLVAMLGIGALWRQQKLVFTRRELAERKQGEAALLTCEQHGGRIDLLLTDVVMPQMSGPQLAERLLLVRPGLRVLFMSGFPDGAIESPEALGPGTRFIGKPFSGTALKRKVREALDSAGPL